MHPKLMLNRKKISDNNHFWGLYVFTSLLELLIIRNKSLVPKTLNLQDSAVHQKKLSPLFIT